LVSAFDPGRARDVVESPIAQVAIQGTWAFLVAEKQVAPAIVVEITGGNSRAAEQVGISTNALRRECVGPQNAGLLRRQESKAPPTSNGRRQLAKTITVNLFPNWRGFLGGHQARLKRKRQ
jgi:hypothetical protein